MKAKPMKNDGYNGPDKEKFFDVLGAYEEQRFEIMRHMSLAGKILAAWEKDGGDKDDLRDAYTLRKLDKDDQQAELRRQFRVASWLGIVDPDRMGQRSFVSLFDVPEEMVGIGGAPFGSRSSIIRSKGAGFRDGKGRSGPSMQEGLDAYGWPADCDEALAYCEGYGLGLPLRPPPKVRKGDADDDQGDEEGGEPGEDEQQPKSALGVMVGQLKEMDAKAAAEKAAAEPKRGPGRPKKQQASMPAPDARDPDEPPGDVSVQSIWDNEPDGPAVPRMVN
jgi:hypothetical protein